MQIATIFRIASMTKPVTSVAVMQLVEQGRMELDESAATYVPELRGPKVLEGFDADGTFDMIRRHDDSLRCES